MTIVAGSTPVNAALIQSTLASALKFPEGMTATGTAQVAPETPAAPVVQPAPVEIPNVSQARTDALGSVDIPTFEDPETPVEAPADATPEEPVSAGSEDDDSDLPESPAAENFKKLRGVIKDTRAAKRQLEEKLTEVSSKLERYEKGEVMPEVVAAKDQRIAQLETYEKIVNLKLSPEYQETFVQPAVALRGELEKLGADYGLPPKLMHQAVGITNRKDLNTFLTRHFDDVGALEVKRVIGDLQELGERALEAENEPQMAMQTLRAQFAERQQQEVAERHNVFEHTAKDAWSKALEKTAAEGAYRELIISPTDPEFNKNVVEPIQQRAATQYGALVKQLAKNGLKELPPELALGLARMVQLSIAGALTINDKVKAEQKAQEIKQHAQRTAPYMRPSIGGQNGSGHANKAQAQTGPMTPQEAARLASQRFGS